MSSLAYVGHDGVIYTTDLDEAGASPVTSSDVPFSWPTWSPDGSLIAASGFRSGSNGHGFLGLYLVYPGGPAPRLIYTNEPGTDAIAHGTPHYCLWSPNGGKVAFIAQSMGGGLGLYLHDLSESGDPYHLVDGGPLYLAWSHDSRFLLIHSRSLHYMVDLEDGLEVRQLPGEASASLYMTPSWSPTDARLAIFRSIGRERQALITADATAGGAEVLTEVDGAAAFAWRPDGSALGLARGLDRKSGYYSGIWLLNADGSGERELSDEPVLCFSWSPEGDRIAYITPSEDAEGSLRWAVVDVQSGELLRVADFRPTQEQLTTFMFFDQYVKSHSPWSPDGHRLIFSGSLGYEEVRRPLPSGASTGVFVADLRSDTAPDQVAEGTIGFWRPV